MQRFNALDFDRRDLLESFHKNGYLILDNALSADHIQRIGDRLKALDAQTKQKKGKHTVGKHTVHKCFHTQEPAVLELLEGSVLVDVAESILYDIPSDERTKWSLRPHLFHCNAFTIPPNGRGQAPKWHTDDPLQNVVVPEGKKLPEWVKLPVLACTYMIWLNDCEEEANGPTCIIPGSHRFGRPVEELKDYVCATGKKGTAVLVNSQTWHRGSKNASNVPRATLQLSFGRRLVGHKFGSIMNYVMPQSVVNHSENEDYQRRIGFLEGGAYS